MTAVSGAAGAGQFKSDDEFQLYYLQGANLTVNYLYYTNPEKTMTAKIPSTALKVNPDVDYYSIGQAYNPSEYIISVPGYTYVTNDAPAAENDRKMVSSGLTMNAYYTQDQYSVSYSFSNAGPEGINPPTVNTKYTYGSDYTKEAAPGKDGWTFSGWTLSEGSYENGKIYSNLKFTGSWTHKSQQVEALFIFDEGAKADFDAAVESAKAIATAEANTAVAGVDTIKQELYNAALDTAYNEYVVAFVPEDILDENNQPTGTQTSPLSKAEYAQNGFGKALADFADAAAAERTTRINAYIANAVSGLTSNLATELSATESDNYQALNGTTYPLAFVKQAPISVFEDAGYDFSSYLSIKPTNFNVSADGSESAAPYKASSISKNTTVVFLLTNNLYTIKVNHVLAVKDGNGGYTYTGTTPSLVQGTSLNENDTYEFAAKYFDGFTLDTEKLPTLPYANDKFTATMETENLEYTLYYKPAETYTVTYVYDGDVPTGFEAPQKVEGLWYNDSVSEPSVTVPDGYTLSVWKLDGAPYTFGTGVTTDITLIATFAKKPYTVTYRYLAGSIEPKGLPADETVKYLEKFTAPTGYENYSTSATEYYFHGWYIADPNATPESTFPYIEYSFDTPASANITLYGEWGSEDVPYTYTVEHYKNGEETPFLTQPAPDAAPFTAVLGATIEADNYALTNVEGYTYANGIDRKISDNEADGANIVKLYYAPVNVTYSVKYLEKDTNNVLSAAKDNVSGLYNQAVTENAVAITNYVPDQASKGLTLKLEGNEIIFYYTYQSPGGYDDDDDEDYPPIPPKPPVEEIKEPEVPKTDVPVEEIKEPEVPKTDISVEEITEPEVPKSDVPYTGDNFKLFGFAMAALLSAAGLVTLTLTDRKKKKGTK